MTERVEFKAQVSDLNTALSDAGLVKPVVDSKGQAGYLLVVKGAECHIYSSDDTQKSRVSFAVSDVTKEGSFVLPTKAVPPLSCLSGTEITLTSVVSEGTHVVQYEAGSRSASQKIPTTDPRVIQSLDEDLTSSVEVAVFPNILLKEALAQTKSYLGEYKDPSTKDVHKHIYLFGEGNGDGFAFTTSGSRSCYFHSPDLAGKRLKLHGMHAALLTNFLTTVSGPVTMRKSETSTYFTDESMSKVVGWLDGADNFSNFEIYGYDKDTHILRISRSELLSSLQYLRKSLDSKMNKIRINYNADRRLLTLQASDNGVETTAPLVAVYPVSSEDSTDTVTITGGTLSKTKDVSCNFNVDYLLDMVVPVKSAEVEIRIAPFPKKENVYLFRVVESFNLPVKDSEASYPCQVLRFSPSKV